jgi:lipoprotein-releasing system permease protein
VVHLITRISVIGISVTTASLIILLAAFNGIESMVEKLYSEFDSDIIIRSTQGKTFDNSKFPYKSLNQVKEITETSNAIEEIVVLRNEKKWVNATLIGVQPSFLKMANIPFHIVDGVPKIEEKNKPMGLIGAVLLDKLGGYIPQNTGFETILGYFPKREAKVSATSNPFHIQPITLAGRINYNKEINEKTLVVPIEFAAKTLNYGNDITAIYLSVDTNSSLENVKASIQKTIGNQYIVKTHLEKNELIYKTSKSEKLIVIAILIFIFILAAFNLVASLTMLYIEKKKNILTLESLGANEQFIFKIFFYEGLLIAFKGVLIGVLIGISICLAQYYGHILTIPNASNQAFPIKLRWTDVLFVFSIVSIISVLSSYLPVKYLVYKNKIRRIDGQIE